MKKKRIHNFETAWQDLIMVVVGVTLAFITLRTNLNFVVWYILLLLGVALISYGSMEMLLVFYWQDPQRLKRWHRERMKQANSGVVWVWAVALAGICVYAIAYYAMVYPTLQLIGIVEGMTSWDADAAFTLNLVKTVLNWHPILFIIGTLIWGFVNSQRREDVTYPIY